MRVIAASPSDISLLLVKKQMTNANVEKKEKEKKERKTVSADGTVGGLKSTDEISEKRLKYYHRK